MLTATLLSQPIIIASGKDRLPLQPPTLGTQLLAAPEWKDLGLDPHAAPSPQQVAAAVFLNTRPAQRLLAIYTAATPRRLAADPITLDRAADRFTTIAPQDLAAAITALLHLPTAESLAAATGINDEAARTRRLIACRDKSSTIVTGGTTLYGSLIDTAAARYGWTLHYILWGITAANLALLLSDRIESLYLTPEEQRRARRSDLQHNRQTATLNAEKLTPQQMRQALNIE